MVVRNPVPYLMFPEVLMLSYPITGKVYLVIFLVKGKLLRRVCSHAALPMSLSLTLSHSKQIRHHHTPLLAACSGFFTSNFQVIGVTTLSELATCHGFFSVLIRSLQGLQEGGPV